MPDQQSQDLPGVHHPVVQVQAVQRRVALFIPFVYAAGILFKQYPYPIEQIGPDGPVYPGKPRQVFYHVILLVVARVAQGVDPVPGVLPRHVGSQAGQQFDHVQVTVAGRFVHAACVHVESQAGHQSDRVPVVRPCGVLHERIAPLPQSFDQRWNVREQRAGAIPVPADARAREPVQAVQGKRPRTVFRQEPGDGLVAVVHRFPVGRP